LSEPRAGCRGEKGFCQKTMHPKNINYQETNMDDERIEERIARKAKNNELPCAVAFDLAQQLNMSPGKMGRQADRMKLRLVKCQLGLFGYLPEKKIVKPADTVAPELEAAIRNAQENDRLPCAAAWQVAEKFKIGKMSVSAACETLGIKIKPCQLGAF